MRRRYNYQTRSDADPKNLLLLCTTQGSAIQQDGAGAKKLFHHAVDPEVALMNFPYVPDGFPIRP